jgi:DNA polymerase-1
MGNISAKKSIKYHTEKLNSLALKLGGRMRELWIARPGKVLVGTDAEGIQLRVLAHYMDDPEFTKAVTEGNKDAGTDPHSFNQKKIGLGTRDNAKTFIYAFLLGAGDEKVGEIYNIGISRGKALKRTYIESMSGLNKLKRERIPADARQGYTVAFDGRRVLCNSDHLMMAAYLQSGEAILMKLAMVLSVSKIREKGIGANLINVVHDEMIFECDEKDSQEVKEITEWSIKAAGEYLNLKCPMKGEGKIGRTWLEVH